MNTRSGLLLAVTAVMVGLAGCGKEEAKKARQELEDAKASLTKLQEQVDATQKSFTELETQHKSVKDELAAAQKAVHDAGTQQKAAEKRLADANEAAAAKLADAQKQIGTLQKQVADLKKAHSISETERKSAEAMAGKLLRENNTLKTEIRKQQEEIRQLRGIKPSAADMPTKPGNENLPRIPASAPVEKLPDPTNPSE